MDKSKHIEEELRKEIAFYKKQLNIMAGRSIRHDLTVTSMRHSLKQNKDVFATLSFLQEKYTVTTPFDTLLKETVKAININLGMDRSVALIPTKKQGWYKLSFHYGFSSDFFKSGQQMEIEIPSRYLNAGQFILVNKKTEVDENIRQIQTQFGMNHFVGIPVIHDDQAVAFIITGRLVERAPFSPALDKGDVDSLTAITSLVSAVLQDKKSIDLELQKTAVEKENEIITSQRDKFEKLLNELKATQAQLIQSEKMASLGELTAGIAHEIQNPLNFVKNFSEVNAELIEELKEEVANGDMEEVKAIAEDIADNEEKIIHHGKRADAIVKGMLQHSRTSTNEKELTDINELADEYLRLAYHGLRAKDNSFNSDFKVELDENLPKINVVPQDIGRVLLNLINNAFSAVYEKTRANIEDYKPEVIVSTNNLEGSVEIRVKDNGSGIPDEIKEKIFQPFFTTKPTGEGTGLGLSLSYDIITKGHGGVLKMDSEEGVGTTFIIQLTNQSL